MDDTLIILIQVLVFAGIAGLAVLVSLFQHRQQVRAWEELGTQTGLTLEPGRYFWSTIRLVGQYRGRALTVDTFSRGSGRSRRLYTRVAAGAVNPAALRLTLSQGGVLSQVGKWLGAQDLLTGEAALDQRYVIKGQPAEVALRVLAGADLRQKLLAAPMGQWEVEGSQVRHARRGLELKVEPLRTTLDTVCALADAVDRLYPN